MNHTLTDKRCESAGCEKTPDPIFSTERIRENRSRAKTVSAVSTVPRGRDSYVSPLATPRDRVEILREAMRKALKDPEFFQRFKSSFGDGYIGLNINSRAPGRQAGLDHFGFEVEDVELVCSRLKERYPKPI